MNDLERTKAQLIRNRFLATDMSIQAQDIIREMNKILYEQALKKEEARIYGTLEVGRKTEKTPKRNQTQRSNSQSSRSSTTALSSRP